MKRPAAAVALAAILVLPGSFLLARAGWVQAKGVVGEALIRRALAATLKDGAARRPWSWADMHPIAALTVPRLGIERPVLSNASGPALAFGIGHIDGTAAPATAGHCVLAGHRDSWAAFLADLRVADEIVMEAPGHRATYRVVATSVVRFDDTRVLRDEGDGRLTLVTCWPFRGLLHSPWRYVVRAEPVAVMIRSCRRPIAKRAARSPARPRARSRPLHGTLRASRSSPSSSCSWSWR
jgi:sortase A